MNVSTVSALTRREPSGQVLAMLEEIAECALQHDEDCADDVRQALSELTPKLLTKLGYTPQTGAAWELNWSHLLWLLGMRRTADEAGRPWDELHKNYDGDIRETMLALCRGERP